jgi:hypothetical protein
MRALFAVMMAEFGMSSVLAMMSAMFPLDQLFQETRPIMASDRRRRSIVSFQPKITFQGWNETGG